LKPSQSFEKNPTAGSLAAPSNSQIRIGKVANKRKTKSNGGIASAETTPARNATPLRCQPDNKMNHPAKFSMFEMTRVIIFPLNSST
jgi:hypothetical protein